MKKQYLTFKFDVPTTPNDFIKLILDFMNINNGIEPSVLIMSMRMKYEILDTFLEYGISLSSIERYYNNDTENIKINGIDLRLIGSPNIHDGIIEVH